MSSKQCKACGEVKSLSDFHVMASAKDGRQGKCKVCACAIAREWTKKNYQRSLDNKRRYYAENKETLRPKKPPSIAN